MHNARRGARCPSSRIRTIKFDYEISMGVRFGEKEWKDTLDQWIGAHEREVQAILASYRVPLLDANGDLIAPRELGANK